MIFIIIVVYSSVLYSINQSLYLSTLNYKHEVIHTFYYILEIRVVFVV